MPSSRHRYHLVRHGSCGGQRQRRGVVTGLQKGTTTLEATYGPNGLVGELTVTVFGANLYAIEIAPSSATIPVDGSVTLQANVVGVDSRGRILNPVGSLAALTWASSDITIATVDDAGDVMGVSAGTATITATNRVSGVAGTLAVQVKALPVSSLQVTPGRVILPSGGATQALIATAIYGSGTTS